MATLASTVWPKPLAVVPCLSWTTAGPTFTRVSLLFQIILLLLNVI